MTTKSTSIYKGKVIDLKLESVELPNGVHCEFEIVHHPGGAAAVALDDQGQVCLLRHFRHAAGDWLWELPAGRLDVGEQPLTTAQRELGEEAGVLATHWDSLGRLVSSPAVLTEAIYLYLARDISGTKPAFEADEVFEIHWLPLSDALARAYSGEIQDAKTVIGLFRAERFLEAERGRSSPRSTSETSGDGEPQE